MYKRKVRSSLGKLLQSYRKAHGLRQVELVKKTGLRQPAVCRMERGKTLPRLDSLASFVTACGGELTLTIKSPRFVGSLNVTRDGL